jgi:hypothetical protein
MTSDVCPQRKYVFHFGDIHETHDYWIIFDGHLTWRILSKSKEIFSKYEKYFIYDFQYSMAFSGPILTKFSTA